MFFLLLFFFCFLQKLTWSQYNFFYFLFFLWGGGLLEINTFIQQGSFKLFKSDDKNIYNVTKDFYFR